MRLHNAASAGFRALLGVALLSLAAWTAPPVGAGPGPGKGPVTGMPLPRFESFRSNMVNLRAGPGFQYPITYVFHRDDLPVEVTAEFDVWRRVEAPDGTVGWIHEALLHGVRSFIVIGGQHVLRVAPRDDAAPAAYLEQGVIGLIRRCDADASWCRVSAGHRTGWLKRADFWGSFEGEAIK
ncbi:MAG TPA: SH3 domain-containing protein [Acetobacteraceae bacterium]|nr:SH3 domain-containing protein [Acetobacteraceae bacterium]